MPSIVISNETPSVITNDVDEIEPQPTNHITLLVKDTDDINKVYFRIKKTTQMRKLMNSYCDRNALDFNSVVFLFNGRRILPHQTPYELDLEDDDAIDAVLYQQLRESINIKVKGQDGFQAGYEIRRSSALKKLMDQYCYKYCLDVNGVGFLFNGYLIQPEQTPFELGIEDGDEMLAMLHLRTGHARCL